MKKSKTEDYVKEKHMGQKRKFSGEPYSNHPIRVADIVREHKTSGKIQELVEVALLHDVLEDTDTSERELRASYGELVLSLVKELTTNTDEAEEIGKKKYLAKKLSDPDKMSSWALVIKLADRLDNINSAIEVEGFSTKSKKFAKRYKEKTTYILDTLESNRRLSKTQKTLVAKIRKMIG